LLVVAFLFACSEGDDAAAPVVVPAGAAGSTSAGSAGAAGTPSSSAGAGGAHGGSGGQATSGGAGASGKGGTSGGAGGVAGKGGASGAGGKAGASGNTGSGGAAGVGGASGAAGSSGSGPPPPPPDIGSVPWTSIGLGVSFKEAPEQPGGAAFLGYAGYAITAPWSEAWVDELYRAHLSKLGVRWLYAIQGPADSAYAAKEIANTKLVAHLASHLDASTSPVIVAGHSSGSFVAHEFLGQVVEQKLDGGKTDGRLVYFDLDGGQSGLDAAIVGATRRAYFFWSKDGGTSSPNAGTMQALGAQYPTKGGAKENDATASGCNQGAPWCLHMTLITQHPHDPSNASGQADYSQFDPAHPVATSWLTSTEADWK
jgi:hypothetical protein